MLNKTVRKVTDRIIKRSRQSRTSYLKRMEAATSAKPYRTGLPCSNFAHGFAACDQYAKELIKGGRKPNIAIVSAYNDMLSAHQPYERFPAIIKDAAMQVGATAQFAGGTPAMCDGITQGQPGMELSLFSRDVIAMSTALALSHNMFDGVLCLGICDKIVPGLLMGALSFGHLPVVFVPGGPMPSGLPNKEKLKIREAYAAGKISKDKLLESEMRSYHSPGTCTFYGTANSNQMLMEIMGLQLPGGTFINPNTPLRDELTREATRTVIRNSAAGSKLLPLYKVLDERTIVNAIIGLLATGGSTNHTIHLVSIAKAAGIKIDWDDFSELSSVIPLLCRIYPNGEADVNDFHDAGGIGFLINELMSAGLVHDDCNTILGKGLKRFLMQPKFKKNGLDWQDSVKSSKDKEVLRPVNSPFSKDGGLRLLNGNLGRAIIKTSAVKEENLVIEAPAKVFTSQQQLQDDFNKGKLKGDFVAVVTFQGPHANGMTELHKLTAPLGVLMTLGQKVALVTDGRMSGASGKLPAAIHVTPECLAGGNLARIKDGDIILLDARKGILEVKLSEKELAGRKPAKHDLTENSYGMGRELFANMRKIVTSAEEGASFILGEA